jgi:hypothetical protein
MQYFIRKLKSVDLLRGNALAVTPPIWPAINLVWNNHFSPIERVFDSSFGKRFDRIQQSRTDYMITQKVIRFDLQNQVGELISTGERIIET